MALPFGLQWRHIHDDAAARIGRFPQANSQYIAGNTKVLNGAGQRKRIGGNDADVSLYMHKTVFIKMLGVHRRRMNVGEHFKLPRAADIVAVARRAIGDQTPLAVHAHLIGRKRFDHALLLGHAANPSV